MRRRPLGATGLTCSEISFGAWQLGNRAEWEPMSDGEARDLVAAALDSDITLFDTAPNYADTRSERILGETLRGRREDVVLVSKFGHRPEGPKDFSTTWFHESLAASLARLRTDHLDVLLLHNPPAEMYAGADPLWDDLEKAKRAGKIRHYGASLDFAHEIEACLANTGSEVLEVLFNILHQDVRRAFPTARAKGTGLVVKIPLDSGWLTGRFGRDTDFTGIRSRWSQADVARRAGLVEQLAWLTADGTPLAQKALAYVLAYDEVSCAIPGIRTPGQLADGVAASAVVITPAEQRRLERFWDDFTAGGSELLPW